MKNPLVKIYIVPLQTKGFTLAETRSHAEDVERLSTMAFDHF